MRARRQWQPANEGGEINISPLIDIVFILLIFFIVTTVFVEETGIEVSKPQATASDNLDKQSILIAISETGEVVYGGREIGVVGVGSVIRRKIQNDDAPVILQTDKSVPADLIVRVIDEAKLAGAKSISIATSVN